MPTALERSDLYVGFRAIQEARLASRFRSVATIYAFIAVVVVLSLAAYLVPLDYLFWGWTGATVVALVKLSANLFTPREIYQMGPIKLLSHVAARALYYPVTFPFRHLQSSLTSLFVRVAAQREIDQVNAIETNLAFPDSKIPHGKFGVLLRPFETDFKELVVDRKALAAEQNPTPMDPVSYIASSVLGNLAPIAYTVGVFKQVIEASDSFGSRPVEFYDWLANATAERAPLITIGHRRGGPYGGPSYLAVDLDSWQNSVSLLIEKSDWIFFVPGTTDGVFWEARTLFQHALPKSILVMLPSYTIRLLPESGQISSNGFECIDDDDDKLTNRTQTWELLVELSREFGVELPGYSPDGALFVFRQDRGWLRLDFPYTFTEIHAAIDQARRMD